MRRGWVFIGFRVFWHVVSSEDNSKQVESSASKCASIVFATTNNEGEFTHEQEVELLVQEREDLQRSAAELEKLIESQKQVHMLIV